MGFELLQLGSTWPTLQNARQYSNLCDAPLKNSNLYDLDPDGWRILRLRCLIFFLQKGGKSFGALF
jgi:hypothetical protein